MTFEPRIGPQGRDDDLTRELRALYAAPEDEAYWNGLAHRIIGRLRDEDGDWSLPLARWARIGVAAAGLALAIASLALTRSREAQALVAYHTIIETPRTAPLQIATESGTGSEREATLRYVIAP
ncbi:MAG TPA: hypothetical protein VFS44_14805 [Gemmatimonadaceae bacterium]|nr:hypothetical protein [Gemmatimonadaceae bacterium]